MAHKINLIFICFCLLLAGFVNQCFGQILLVTPTYPTVDDSVTIIYDASLGNGELLNNTLPVYAFTAVIKDNTSGWYHIQTAPWGTNDPKLLMTSMGNNKYKISFKIRNFYGIPLNEPVYKMAFVFRNETSALVGRDSNGADIFYNVCGSTTDFIYSINGFNASFQLSSPNIISQNWVFGDGSSSSLQNPSHTYSAVGNYSVILTTTDTCGYPSYAIKQVNISGISHLDIQEQSNFDFVPNPVENELLLYRNGDCKEFQIEIFHSNGNIIFSKKIDNPCSTEGIKLSTTFLAKGIYFIKFSNEKEVLVKKIVKI